MMKKILCLFCISAILFGCSNNNKAERLADKNTSEQGYAVSTYLNSDMKKAEEEGSAIMASIEAKEPNEWAVDADFVVLATIISLDRVETVLPDGAKHELGFTFGDMLIQNTYKGDSLNGKVVEYSKEGGVISMAQHDEAAPEADVEKRRRLREESGNTEDQSTIFINTTIAQDISFQEGKTYLLALRYVEKFDCYNVIGLNIMSREADIPQTKFVRAINDLTDITIKNNDDGTFEPIDQVLSKMQVQ